MDDLLASVLDAHGGIDRWARVHTITARLSIGGPFWSRKGWPEIFGDQTTLELEAHRQHIVVTPFNGLDRRSVFDVDPERVVVYTNDGIAVERRDDPRASFAGYEVTTPWDGFADRAPARHSVAPLLEPLSDREQTILRYLPTTLSNREIAAELFVTTNTVKTHLRAIYRKLDVARRREAVERARDLRLLSRGSRRQR
jgi:DNA-binding CsgD family transcriptional regulator